MQEIQNNVISSNENADIYSEKNKKAILKNTQKEKNDDVSAVIAHM